MTNIGERKEGLGGGALKRLNEFWSKLEDSQFRLRTYIRGLTKGRDDEKAEKLNLYVEQMIGLGQDIQRHLQPDVSEADVDAFVANGTRLIDMAEAELKKSQLES